MVLLGGAHHKVFFVFLHMWRLLHRMEAKIKSGTFLAESCVRASDPPVPNGPHHPKVPLFYAAPKGLSWFFFNLDSSGHLILIIIMNRPIGAEASLCLNGQEKRNLVMTFKTPNWERVLRFLLRETKTMYIFLSCITKITVLFYILK